MSDGIIDPKLLLRSEVSNMVPIKVGAKYNAFAEIKNKLNTEPLRLGANENPYGPSPLVVQAIQKNLAEVHRYPDNTCYELSEKMAAFHGVDPGRLMFDCGSESIMAKLINYCIKPGDKILSFSPSFPFIDIIAQAAGAELISLPHEDDLTFSTEKFCDALANGVRYVYLCMPNNPTGTYFTGPELEKILNAAHPETLFILDEAYVEFALGKLDYPNTRKILEAVRQPYISLRTMSKAYALAGMRIGYAITYCEEFTALLKPGPVFNVGLLTLEAAMAALEDKDHLERYINIVSSERTRVEKELKSLGIRFFNSAGNFTCLSLPTLEQAQSIETELQNVGIFVKGQKGRNNEGVVRITIGRPEDNDRVLESLAVN